MSGVGGDDENGGADGGEKDGEDGAASGFSDAAFAADEDPLERLLFQNVLHRSFYLIRHRIESMMKLNAHNTTLHFNRAGESLVYRVPTEFEIEILD